MFYLYLIITVLLSLTILIFGFIFIKRPPKNINYLYGYRTTMSMKNQDTWDFAHRYAGKVWIILGFISLFIFTPLTIILMGEKNYDYIMLVLIILQVSFLILVIPFTETALRKTFDKDGKRKNNRI